MTVSEEQLRVGTTEREAGRVRLKKYVVEDEVTETVPVRREEVRVEREPITDANRDAALDGPDISEDEHEVVLREENVVAEKRTVPKERVRLEKDVESGEETVSETVRSERVDVDATVASPTPVRPEHSGRTRRGTPVRRMDRNARRDPFGARKLLLGGPKSFRRCRGAEGWVGQPEVE